jgi:hypothetical protein
MTTLEAKVTRAEAYRYFGTRPKNVYRSLSAKSADGRAVAITLWNDKFNGPPGLMIYELSCWGDWHRGNCQAFFEDLEHAITHCGGIVFVVLVARDRTALQVRSVDCYPAKNWAMRITHLDSASGTFRLEQCALPFANRPLAA